MTKQELIDIGEYTPPQPPSFFEFVIEIVFGFLVKL